MRRILDFTSYVIETGKIPPDIESFELDEEVVEALKRFYNQALLIGLRGGHRRQCEELDTLTFTVAELRKKVDAMTIELKKVSAERDNLWRELMRVKPTYRATAKKEPADLHQEFGALRPYRDDPRQ